LTALWGQNPLPPHKNYIPTDAANRPSPETIRPSRGRRYVQARTSKRRSGARPGYGKIQIPRGRMSSGEGSAMTEST
jgi:hypothetical protein